MIIQGDSMQKLKELEPNSIDTIITDPPYGLSFMGKKWDYDVPSVELWQECLRVLKPGGTALIFAGSRTQHRMAVNVEDAGFILKDCIMWLYGSGFPKATDISKQLDKGHGRKREKRFVGNIKGASLHHKTDNSRVWEMVETNEAVTPEAKLWNGWKSHGLKPAYEPILVAMKPNDGTYANNALKHGVSGLNIDGGRIEIPDNDPNNRKGERGVNKVTGEETWLKIGQAKRGAFTQGRFPANIILDEEAGRLLDEQSGVSKSSDAVRKNKVAPLPPKDGWNDNNMVGQDSYGFNDKGGASRFFYCAKASKAERNKGCEGLEEKGATKMDGGKFESASTTATTRKAQNHHPTVKPLKLMEYLCTLTKTPTGGVVLDPFAGSGTTGLACQNTDRDFVLIEREPEYIEIIKARLKSNDKLV